MEQAPKKRKAGKAKGGKAKKAATFQGGKAKKAADAKQKRPVAERHKIIIRRVCGGDFLIILDFVGLSTRTTL